jgi:hypothetical protein
MPVSPAACTLSTQTLSLLTSPAGAQKHRAKLPTRPMSAGPRGPPAFADPYISRKLLTHPSDPAAIMATLACGSTCDDFRTEVAVHPPASAGIGTGDARSENGSPSEMQADPRHATLRDHLKLAAAIPSERLMQLSESFRKAIKKQCPVYQPKDAFLEKLGRQFTDDKGRLHGDGFMLVCLEWCRLGGNHPIPSNLSR